MSSTRYAAADAPISQEAYASSNVHELGLLGNLVTRRCKVAMRPEHRALCYFIQQLSHRDGGLDRVVSEILAAFPERFQSPMMKKVGVRRGETLEAKQRQELMRVGDIPAYQERRIIPTEYFVDGTSMRHDWGHKGERIRFPRTADALFEECERAAAAKMASVLRAICLDPRTDLEAVPFWYFPAGERESRKQQVWWIDDIVGTLELFRQTHIKAAKDAIAETTVSKMVYEAIDIATYCKGLAVVEGFQRTGKTTAAANYCATHPGQTVFITLEEGRDDTTFFRSIARSIGTASSGQLKAIELRGRIEDMLQAGHLTIVLDEAHFLVPLVDKPKSAPKRLDWVRTSLLDKGVAVVLVSTPQFDRQCDHYEKHLSWNAKQLRGRLYWQKLLPATLPDEEVFAVASKIAPHVGKGTIARLAAYAVDSTEFLFGIQRIIKLATFHAERDGRSAASRGDIDRALDEIAPGKLSVAKNESAAVVDSQGESFRGTFPGVSSVQSMEVPSPLARRAVMSLPDSEKSGFGASERLRFTEEIASE